MKASSTPKISVVMAVYNGKPYLKEAVESILKQTYKNFEFIVIDDASTDGSLKYLKSVGDKRVKLIINKKNLGLAKSLNVGLRRSTGKYIARMDADDVSIPKRLETQVKFLEENPTVDLAGAWADLINEKGEKIGEKKYPVKPDEVKKAITWYAAVIHPTYMAKSNFFRKLKGYRPNFDYAEDYDLLSRARRDYRIVNIPKKLLLWRLQDKRRSRENMGKMDKVDLMIKIEAIKRDGPSVDAILALVRKLILNYFFPFPIKKKIATIIKQA